MNPVFRIFFEHWWSSKIRRNLRIPRFALQSQIRTIFLPSLLTLVRDKTQSCTEITITVKHNVKYAATAELRDGSKLQPWRLAGIVALVRASDQFLRNLVFFYKRSGILALAIIILFKRLECEHRFKGWGSFAEPCFPAFACSALGGRRRNVCCVNAARRKNAAQGTEYRAFLS